ncbi:Uncharacterized membrane protein YczE [Pelagirhabdus alkalitolerans]|uniref:Uncharacterized membrane protein YczE n=1 Tax=Pelagirhabdus alkalitolerans TaxID=1612202 RepID=A0A1G6KKT9_9BACI|nr:membrane protein [Pelagirhabdus alkalitolerans]SDC31574.1 Uncharacterized membrane protein YczE [Pelagirhabdus alkalitolerans]
MSKLQLKLLMMILGNILLGFAIGVFIIAELGTDPFATMNLGVSSTLGWSFGNYQLVFNSLLFIVILLYGRHLIGIGTLVNMTALGYIADFTVYSYEQLPIESIPLVIRLIMLAIGIILASLGLSLYITAQLGVAPYDALPLIIMAFTKDKVSFAKARMGVDILAVIIGFLFGAVVNIGTLIIAVSLGNGVAFFNRRVSEPLLKRYDVIG